MKWFALSTSLCPSIEISLPKMKSEGDIGKYPKQASNGDTCVDE